MVSDARLRTRNGNKRLRRFTARHPDIDVRIAATTDTLNLERSLIDLAIRYCKPDNLQPIVNAQRAVWVALMRVQPQFLSATRSRREW